MKAATGIVIVTFVGVVVACGVGACSSVPDVRFADQDGAAGDGGTDGAPRDAGPDAPKCPGSPPAGGVCCGNKICEGCTTNDCTACTAAACAADDVCCPIGASGKISCKPLTCK